MTLLDRIAIDADVVHGRPRVAGTRMRVSDVLGLLATGAPLSEILEDYPYLVEADVMACLEYAAVQSDHSILVS